MKKYFLSTLLISFLSFNAIAQNNLLDTSTWNVGSETVPGFNRYGPSSSNIREMDISPYGTSELIWKSLANSSSDSDGGWNTDYVTIDPSKTYRFTVWIKKINSFDGFTYHGFNSLDTNDNESSLFLNGNAKNNPYFKVEDPPTLNEWYLYVGFVYAHNHNGGVNGLEGIYDMSGNRVFTGFTSYKFSSTTVKVRHRTYLRVTDAPTAQYFYGLTIYAINGQEPSIQELIDGSSGGGGDTSAPTSPTLSSTGKTDTTVNLSWTGAMDNTAVTGYKVYRGSTLEATLGNVTNYQLTGLTASTAYGFTVKALDAVGNESSNSNAVSVTTDATSGGGGTTSSNWNQNGTNINYTNGNVAIGTTTIPSGYKMAIDGKLITEEVKVELSGEWPDYVFLKDYQLPTLQEVEQHIQEKGHLINIPSAAEVEENGIELGQMNKLLLEKIEELTLYTIEQQKTMEYLVNEINMLKDKK